MESNDQLFDDLTSSQDWIGKGLIRAIQGALMPREAKL